MSNIEPISQELLDLAERAVREMEDREPTDEEMRRWAKRIARQSAEAGEIEYEDIGE